MVRAPLRAIYSLFKEAVDAWVEDYAPSMGAALSYYTLFSIAPLLLIAVGVAGLAFGEQAARGEIFGQLRELMGDQGASADKRSEEHTSEFQSLRHLVCRLLLEKK